ncbi:hypothetical protein DPMN_153945 [Dreissena polymorpha]|uniref:Uncharacterized protein n=1 Tax=Dreissena polymorpha TaxID=45954 RepID=A0A9D4FQU7_DREPO|nr:hypothetical protein DPMN_153945 [Dreissena polymorpha]
MERELAQSGCLREYIAMGSGSSVLHLSRCSSQQLSDDSCNTPVLRRGKLITDKRGTVIEDHLQELGNNGTCDIGKGDICDCIPIVGDGFVETAICNVTIYEVCYII